MKPALQRLQSQSLRARSSLLYRGQAMLEYLVVCGVLVVLLGVGMIDDKSILWQLIHAFQSSYRNFSYAISLPS